MGSGPAVRVTPEIGDIAFSSRAPRFNAQLENLLNRFDRVLVVYGGSHLCRERRMLERLLGSPENVKPF